MKYTRGIKELYHMNVVPRDFMTRLVLLHGVKGEGKSYLSRCFPNPYTVPKATSSQFYDGYDPNEHQTIIYDDFKGKLEFGELLKLADEGPYRVNTKGGVTLFKPFYLVITSNYKPEEWYFRKFNDPKAWPSFERRVWLEIEFKGNFVIKIIKPHPVEDDLPIEVEDVLKNRFNDGVASNLIEDLNDSDEEAYRRAIDDVNNGRRCFNSNELMLIQRGHLNNDINSIDTEGDDTISLSSDSPTKTIICGCNGHPNPYCPLSKKEEMLKRVNSDPNNNNNYN